MFGCRRFKRARFSSSSPSIQAGRCYGFDTAREAEYSPELCEELGKVALRPTPMALYPL